MSTRKGRFYKQGFKGRKVYSYSQLESYGCFDSFCTLERVYAIRRIYCQAQRRDVELLRLGSHSN